MRHQQTEDGSTKRLSFHLSSFLQFFMAHSATSNGVNMTIQRLAMPLFDYIPVIKVNYMALQCYCFNKFSKRCFDTLNQKIRCTTTEKPVRGRKAKIRAYESHVKAAFSCVCVGYDTLLSSKCKRTPLPGVYSIMD